MDLDSVTQQWRTHGFVILPGFVPAAERKPALEELPAMYPGLNMTPWQQALRGKA